MAVARWTKVSSAEVLKRSSHNVEVVDRKAFIFGGELVPRKPRDNILYKIDLNSKRTQSSSRDNSIDLIIREASDCDVSEATNGDDGPSARVGSASAVIGKKIYLFSGRGGEAMTPIEENGTVWEFDTARSTWSCLTPSGVLVPQARSYHCATSDGNDRFWIHSGCPASGRLADLWEFSISRREWKQCAEAPSPQRGGSSVTFCNGLLYRANGFDGQTEQGGSIDVFDPEQDSWSTKSFQGDGRLGPAPRSVGCLLPVSIRGQSSLVTFFGEGDPSSLGHAGAGKMFGDIWVYDIDTDAWSCVKPSGSEHPCSRGWFDAAAVSSSSLFVSGGLDEKNDRLPDAWILSF